MRGGEDELGGRCGGGEDELGSVIRGRQVRVARATAAPAANGPPWRVEGTVRVPALRTSDCHTHSHGGEGGRCSKPARTKLKDGLVEAWFGHLEDAHKVFLGLHLRRVLTVVLVVVAHFDTVNRLQQLDVFVLIDGTA